MHVLLVEDDLVLADGIARILRGHGMVVDVVNNGDDADRALATREMSASTVSRWCAACVRAEVRNRFCC